MLGAAAAGRTLRVVSDQVTAPSYTLDLARVIWRILKSGRAGIYHVSGSGETSWYEFAREIFRIADLGVEVVPVPASEYPLPAARPANGLLSDLGSPKLRHWREALADYLEQESSRSS
jgi:dTDP-4-dehydrorhamnose reductase